jgi:hypothetical protein
VRNRSRDRSGRLRHDGRGTRWSFWSRATTERVGASERRRGKRRYSSRPCRHLRGVSRNDIFVILQDYLTHSQSGYNINFCTNANAKTFRKETTRSITKPSNATKPPKRHRLLRLAAQRAAARIHLHRTVPAEYARSPSVCCDSKQPLQVEVNDPSHTDLPSRGRRRTASRHTKKHLLSENARGTASPRAVYRTPSPNFSVSPVLIRTRLLMTPPPIPSPDAHLGR